jgi:ABC-2 type transport system permease protein
MTGTGTVLAAPDTPVSGAGGAADPARHALRPVVLLWRREMVRLRRNPARLAMGLVTPLLFLLVLGTGLDAASGLGRTQLNSYRAFLFPGTLVMCVQAPAIAVGISLVWDRRLGLLRQMLVTPFPRSTILLGLALGGATTGTVYGLLVLSVGGVAGVPYTPAMLVVLAEILLISLMFTALGLLAAVTIRHVDTFQIVVSLSLMPLMFFSGAVFPPNGLPGWLAIAVKLNPLTYGVDAVRRTLSDVDVLGSGQTDLLIGSWHPPVVAELGLLTAIIAVALGLASHRFSRAQ